MKTIEKQIEKIIDEGSGFKRSIIIQMKSDDDNSQELIKIAAEVHNRRNLSLTARDLLPGSQRDLEQLKQSVTKGSSAKIKADVRDTLATSEASLATQLSPALVQFERKRLKSSGLKSLSPLMSNNRIQKAISENLAKKQKKNNRITESQVPKFWASRSLVLDIDKDDLYKLSEEVDQIQDVFLNHALKLPRLVEAKNLPLQVIEQKGSSWGINKIGALAVWGAYNARGRGIKVAVLDTGVDPDHADLKGKISDWVEFDDDCYEIPNSIPHDTDQHGTHCAGIIAGGNASGAWIGVAPEAKIAAALVLKEGNGTFGQILAGIQWAIDIKVDVISMSLGAATFDFEVTGPYATSLLNAQASGIPVVTAIGNDGSQTTGTPGNDCFAFSVGATDYIDRSAGFSGGRTHVINESKYINPDFLPLIYSKPEVTAPGVAIKSSIPGNKWAAFNGTSMATPHVAGAIALLLSATNIKSLVDVRQKAVLLEDIITGSVEELGESGQDHRFGFGRIDVLKAIGFAKELGY